MDVPHILQTVGMWGIIISVTLLAVAGYTALLHPKCKKDKALYELMMTFTFIILDINFFFVFLSAAPLFYASEVPSNIKVGLIIGGICGMFVGALSAKTRYDRYKEALKMFSENQNFTGV